MRRRMVRRNGGDEGAGGRGQLYWSGADFSSTAGKRKGRLSEGSRLLANEACRPGVVRLSTADIGPLLLRRGASPDRDCCLPRPRSTTARLAGRRTPPYSGGTSSAQEHDFLFF
ncbi:hypothetical protein MRX96_028132 [Rhipicephalus microplus]